MQLRTWSPNDVQEKRVMLRVTLDVHYRLEGTELVVEDDARIRAIIPFVQQLIGLKSKVILLSWLQRPKGKVDEQLRMAPVGKRLQELLGRNVIVLKECIGEGVRKAIDDAPAGSVLLLENVRFHPGEDQNDPLFARELSRNADLFLNDAFGQSHRKAASIIGIPKFIPSFAGPSLQREVEVLSGMLENPQRPFVAIIGGAKISTKLGVINTLLQKADNVLLGGALANTVLRAQGVQIGASLVEDKVLANAKDLPLTDPRLHLPVDVIVAKEATVEAPTRRCAVGKVQMDERILDVGRDTTELFRNVVSTAKTVVWNGPMGYFELEKFAEGTDEIARTLSNLSSATTIVGGGETVASIRRLKLEDKMTFVSMGGGAMLDFIEQGTLAGIEPLRIS
ncbi:MAG: phosphoglycerate kinase [Patescibacteria group bacterium]|jgi:phosphoglycerate kinase